MVIFYSYVSLPEGQRTHVVRKMIFSSGDDDFWVQRAELFGVMTGGFLSHGGTPEWMVHNETSDNQMDDWGYPLVNIQKTMENHHS